MGRSSAKKKKDRAERVRKEKHMREQAKHALSRPPTEEEILVQSYVEQFNELYTHPSVTADAYDDGEIDVDEFIGTLGYEVVNPIAPDEVPGETAYKIIRAADAVFGDWGNKPGGDEPLVFRRSDGSYGFI
jgi:hypothetical protein